MTAFWWLWSEEGLRPEDPYLFSLIVICLCLAGLGIAFAVNVRRHDD